MVRISLIIPYNRGKFHIPTIGITHFFRGGGICPPPGLRSPKKPRFYRVNDTSFHDQTVPGQDLRESNEIVDGSNNLDFTTKNLRTRPQRIAAKTGELIRWLTSNPRSAGAGEDVK